MTAVPTGIEALAAFYVKVGLRVLEERSRDGDPVERGLQDLGQIPVPDGARERCWKRAEEERAADGCISRCVGPESAGMPTRNGSAAPIPGSEIPSSEGDLALSAAEAVCGRGTSGGPARRKRRTS